MRWSKGSIIKAIQEHNNKGVSLIDKDIRVIDSKLHASACSPKHFGSWREAMKASGLRYLGNTPNLITTVGDTKCIIVTNREGKRFTVVVDSWVDLPSSVNVSGGYPRVKVDGVDIGLHNYIYGKVADGNFVDHIDRDKLNNKMSNLRELTNSQNQMNRKAKGYTFNINSGKYESRITVNRKRIFLGKFNTKTEARIAYLKAKLKYHKGYCPEEIKEELLRLINHT